jgi:hypothetical protein
MYDSLKPYLRFTPKPLDVYIAQSADRATRQNLPTIDAVAGYRPSSAGPPLLQRSSMREAQPKLLIARRAGRHW